MTFEETLYPHWAQVLKAHRTLLHEKTEFQDLVIFESAAFGRVLALDGVVQTTEADEAHYHEMMAHVPILAHGNVRNVLIVGGGDGGILREVVKHPDLRVTMVEIDASVIKMCRKYLPFLSDGAFDNARARIVIDDGAKFVSSEGENFDVIIVDSTDPHGPGAVLFSESFYADCRRRMAPGGVMVTQNGVPFLQPDELSNSWHRLRACFSDVWFTVTVVPTYIGGFMAMGWASLDPALRQRSVEQIRSRFDSLGLKTRYYTPEIHVGSFALPQYIRDLML